MKSWVARMLAGMMVLAGMSLFLLPSGQAPAADDGGSKALQGTWRGVRFLDSKNDKKGVELQLTFKGNHLVANRVAGGKEGDLIGEGDIKVSADGKNLDAVGTTGGYKNKTYHGIIKIEGDTLTWCTAPSGKTQQRPKEFVGDPGEHTILIIVKKQK